MRPAPKFKVGDRISTLVLQWKTTKEMNEHDPELKVWSVIGRTYATDFSGVLGWKYQLQQWDPMRGRWTYADTRENWMKHV